jgi:hypothetical protein
MLTCVFNAVLSGKFTFANFKSNQLLHDPNSLLKEAIEVIEKNVVQILVPTLYRSYFQALNSNKLGIEYESLFGFISEVFKSNQRLVDLDEEIRDFFKCSVFLIL